MLLSFENEEYLSEAKLYPTLTSNNMNFMIGGILSNNFEIKINDLKGPTHVQSNITTGLNTINVSNLVSGSYIVQIKKGNPSVTRKFIKE